MRSRPQLVQWTLRLYVAGMTPAADRALANIEGICRLYLPDTCSFEVVDLMEEPYRGEEDQIFAAPTLVRVSPAPTRKIVGDLSDTAKVIDSLGIRAEGETG